ncbi:hypothetical protein [Thermus sp.]|jgi:hypothetical protein|uniref:hypothetical protein n=1 Tax=Thermus sp. TaxID=275 RepID=UPI003D10ED31
MGEMPALEALEALGRAFSGGEAWAYLGLGLLSGYALGRVVRAVVPWLALLYLGAALLGRADVEVLVRHLGAASRELWAFLSGLPAGLSLGGAVGFLSALSDR